MSNELPSPKASEIAVPDAKERELSITATDLTSDKDKRNSSSPLGEDEDLFGETSSAHTPDGSPRNSLLVSQEETFETSFSHTDQATGLQLPMDQELNDPENPRDELLTPEGDLIQDDMPLDIAEDQDQSLLLEEDLAEDGPSEYMIQDSEIQSSYQDAETTTVASPDYFSDNTHRDLQDNDALEVSPDTQPYDNLLSPQKSLPNKSHTFSPRFTTPRSSSITSSILSPLTNPDPYNRSVPMKLNISNEYTQSTQTVELRYHESEVVELNNIDQANTETYQDGEPMQIEPSNNTELYENAEYMRMESSGETIKDTETQSLEGEESDVKKADEDAQNPVLEHAQEQDLQSQSSHQQQGLIISSPGEDAQIQNSEEQPFTIHSYREGSEKTHQSNSTEGHELDENESEQIEIFDEQVDNDQPMIVETDDIVVNDENMELDNHTPNLNPLQSDPVSEPTSKSPDIQEKQSSEPENTKRPENSPLSVEKISSYELNTNDEQMEMELSNDSKNPSNTTLNHSNDSRRQPSVSKHRGSVEPITISGENGLKKKKHTSLPSNNVETISPEVTNTDGPKQPSAPVLFANSTTVLTEHFGYAPIALIDDVVNAANHLVYQCVGALESFLVRRHPEKDVRKEIELGTAKFETLMESVVDRAFDKYELYLVRNILTIPSELIDGGWIRLGHQKGIAFGEEAESVGREIRDLEEEMKHELGLAEILESKLYEVNQTIQQIEAFKDIMEFGQTREVAPLEETLAFLTDQVQEMLDGMQDVKEILNDDDYERFEVEEKVERDLFVNALTKRAVINTEFDYDKKGIHTEVKLEDGIDRMEVEEMAMRLREIEHGDKMEL